MRREVYWATAIGLLAATPPAAAQHPGSAGTTAREIYATIVRADTVALRALLSPRLRWVFGSSGAVATKRQLMRAASRPIPDVLLEYQLDSVETWERSGVAIVDYVLTNRRTFRAYQTIFTSRVSDTFIRDHGRWRLLRHAQTWVVPQFPQDAAAHLRRLAVVARQLDDPFRVMRQKVLNGPMDSRLAKRPALRIGETVLDEFVRIVPRPIELFGGSAVGTDDVNVGQDRC